MLDIALRRNRPLMAEALRKLGGVPATQLTGKAALERDRISAETDWDLVPTGEVR